MSLNYLLNDIQASDRDNPRMGLEEKVSQKLLLNHFPPENQWYFFILNIYFNMLSKIKRSHHERAAIEIQEPATVMILQ